MAIQTDGKIVVVGDAITIRAVGGNSADGFLARYNIDGSRDITFGGGDGLVLETGVNQTIT